MKIEEHLNSLYNERFKAIGADRRKALWHTLCRYFFQQYVSRDMHVLDLGAGFCEFINAIQCKTKYAVDLNEHFSQYAEPEVNCFVSSVTDLSCIEKQSVDMVFMSNLLEHLTDKNDILMTFRQIHDVLKSNGRMMLLQPNIRYLYKTYWDYFDHHIPLSDRSVTEALHLTGYSVQRLIPGFLPYTTKSRLPQHPFFVKLYLMCPPAWKIFGKQMFILATKS